MGVYFLGVYCGLGVYCSLTGYPSDESSKPRVGDQARMGMIWKVENVNEESKTVCLTKDECTERDGSSVNEE